MKDSTREWKKDRNLSPSMRIDESQWDEPFNTNLVIKIYSYLILLFKPCIRRNGNSFYNFSFPNNTSSLKIFLKNVLFKRRKYLSKDRKLYLKRVYPTFRTMFNRRITTLISAYYYYYYYYYAINHRLRLLN